MTLKHSQLLQFSVFQVIVTSQSRTFNQSLIISCNHLGFQIKTVTCYFSYSLMPCAGSINQSQALFMTSPPVRGSVMNASGIVSLLSTRTSLSQSMWKASSLEQFYLRGFLMLLHCSFTSRFTPLPRRFLARKKLNPSLPSLFLLSKLPHTSIMEKFNVKFGIIFPIKSMNHSRIISCW